MRDKIHLMSLALHVVQQLEHRGCPKGVGATPTMQSMIYTAFYTRNTLYEVEVQRLIKSLDKFKLPHDIVAVDSLGSWTANTKLTALHILSMMDKYPAEAIVQLDADAVIWEYPRLFHLDYKTALPADPVMESYSMAAHRRRNGELLNGTLFINPSAKKTIKRYYSHVLSNPEHRNEQWWLDVACRELKTDMYNLPARYCWIHDIMKDDLAPGEKPVIEHLQASRESTMCKSLKNRRSRLEVIDGMADSTSNG